MSRSLLMMIIMKVQEDRADREFGFEQRGRKVTIEAVICCCDGKKFLWHYSGERSFDRRGTGQSVYFWRKCGSGSDDLDLTSVIDLSDKIQRKRQVQSGSPVRHTPPGNISLTAVSATVQKSSGVAVLPGGVVNLKNSSMVSHGDAAVKLV